MTNERAGDWMQTFTGRKFYPLAPRADDVAIEDIAHALSMVCRFGGHCREFYSVAEHSVRVSLICGASVALAGLLHDASEAYLGDMIRPLKTQPEMLGFKHAEERVELAIAMRFGTPSRMPDAVKWADESMLATEARDIMGGESAGKWALRAQPQPERIAPWSPAYARDSFLARFRALGGS